MRYKDPDLMIRIKDFAERYYHRYEKTPSNREIASALGVGVSTVHRYLHEMDENHIIEYDGRNISSESIRKTAGSTVGAIVGSISCGTPTYEEEDIEAYVRLPKAVFGDGKFFLLNANGDSMINAGIDDGDLIVCRQDAEVRDGDIIVALYEGQNTLKRIFRENGRVVLKPENPRYSEIEIKTDDFYIQGVATHVIKSLNSRVLSL